MALLGAEVATPQLVVAGAQAPSFGRDLVQDSGTVDAEILVGVLFADRGESTSDEVFLLQVADDRVPERTLRREELGVAEDVEAVLGSRDGDVGPVRRLVEQESQQANAR